MKNNLEMKYRKKIQRSVAPKKNREKSWETAPSIPSAHNKMLFFSEDEESDHEGTTSGSSIIKKVSKPKKGEEEKPEVSPFSYKPDFSKLKSETNGPSWAMSKSQRITFESNAKKLVTGKEIGPGKYDSNKQDIGNAGIVEAGKPASSFYQNQSSTFKSNVERMAYMEPKVKTFVAGKLVKGPVNSRQDVGGNDVTIVPEISPGPGDYYTYTNPPGAINLASKPHHMQFFGSTEERVVYFDTKKPKNDINSNFRGPGAYDVERYKKDIPRQDTFHKGYSSSFISGRDKDLLFSGNSNPAPGDYKSTTGVNRIHGKVWSKISTFGSTEKRFKEAEYLNPGPGTYNTIKKDRKKKAVSGFNFKSGTKRELFGNQKHLSSEVTNLQDYKSIASEIEKLSGGAPNNFTILKNERYIMPFNSVSPRFKEENPSHLSTSKALGPGFYPTEVKKLRSLHKTNLSFGRSERFNVPKNTSPGPGQYNNHRSTTWIK